MGFITVRAEERDAALLYLVKERVKDGDQVIKPKTLYPIPYIANPKPYTLYPYPICCFSPKERAKDR